MFHVSNNQLINVRYVRRVARSVLLYSETCVHFSKICTEFLVFISGYGVVNFEPRDISQTITHEVIYPGQSNLTSLKNSTDNKCHLVRWKFHFPRQKQVRPILCVDQQFLILASTMMFMDILQNTKKNFQKKRSSFHIL